MAKFSLLMCTYNSEATFEYSIGSVINQSYADWELVILDNGSADRTVDILRRYESAYEQLNVIYGEINLGWAKGTSVCMSHATGDYMMFIAADDILPHNDVLKEINAFIEKEEYPDVVLTGYMTASFDGTGFNIAHSSKDFGAKRVSVDDRIDTLYECMSTTYYNSMFHYLKLSFLRENNIDFFSPYWGDCVGVTNALLKAKSVAIYSKPSYVLTINTSQTRGRTKLKYDEVSQWGVVKKEIKDLNARFEKYEISRFKIMYIAKRIFDNVSSCCTALIENMVVDEYMNEVSATPVDIFLEIESRIDSDDFGDMMYYSNGRCKYLSEMVGAVGVYYYLLAKYHKYTEEIDRRSIWLAALIKSVMFLDEVGGGVYSGKATFQSRMQIIL